MIGVKNSTLGINVTRNRVTLWLYAYDAQNKMVIIDNHYNDHIKYWEMKTPEQIRSAYQLVARWMKISPDTRNRLSVSRCHAQWRYYK